MVRSADLIDPVVVRHPVTLPSGERLDEVLVEGAVLDSYECTFRFMLDEGCLPDRSMTSACCYRGCIVTPDEVARYERDLGAILASGALDEVSSRLVREAAASGRLAHDVRECGPACAPDREETTFLEETLRLKGDGSAARDGYRCTFTRRPDGDGCLFRTRATVEFRGRRVPLNLCGIHAYALGAGLEPYEYKPTDCELWPLYLVRLDDGRVALVSQPAHLPHANMQLHCVVSPLPPAAAGGREAGLPMFETMPHVRRYFGDSFLGALHAARTLRDAARGGPAQAGRAASIARSASSSPHRARTRRIAAGKRKAPGRLPSRAPEAPRPGRR